MSDASQRKVSIPVVIATLGVFAMFLLIVLIARTPANPLEQAANVPEEEQWRLTAEGRKQRLTEVRGSARSAADEYAWIDQNAGVVRIPVDEAIRLTIEEINAQRQ